MLIPDANILIRDVLGAKVQLLLHKYAERAEFLAPLTAFQEARGRLPEILEADKYEHFETIARQRLARRDEDDWPVLAAALALGCSIWTEDNDFFGCGVATWTSDRVEFYLADQSG